MTVCHLSRKGKNFLIALLVLALLALPAGAWFYYQLNQPVSIETGKQTSYFESGNGSVDAPYEIAHPVQLYYFTWLQNLGKFNGDNVPVRFKVSADLDMQGFVLPPAGTIEFPFVGSFEGGGHTISNLTVRSSTPEDGTTDVPKDGQTDPQIVGFFGVIGNYEGGATHVGSVSLVQNLTLNKATVSTVKPKDGQSLIGIVAGYVNGPVSNVKVVDSQLLIGGEVKPLSSTSSAYSDYTLVGYCTDERKEDLDIETIEIFDPSAKVSTFLDEGSGSWGSSIPMKDIFTRLETVYTEARNPDSTINGYSNTYADVRTDNTQEVHTHADNSYLSPAFGGYLYHETLSPFLSYSPINPNANSKEYYGPNVPVPGTGPNSWGRDLTSSAGSYSFSSQGADQHSTQYYYLSGSLKDPKTFPDQIKTTVNKVTLRAAPMAAYYITATDNAGITHYLTLDENRTGITDATDQAQATLWILDPQSNNIHFTGADGIKHYLVGNPYPAINNNQLGSGVTSWKKNANPDGTFSLSFTHNYSSTAITFYLAWSETEKNWTVSHDSPGSETPTVRIEGESIFQKRSNQPSLYFVVYQDSDDGNKLKIGTSNSPTQLQTTQNNYKTFPWIFIKCDGTTGALLNDIPRNELTYAYQYSNIVMSVPVGEERYYLTQDLIFTKDPQQAAHWNKSAFFKNPETVHKFTLVGGKKYLKLIDDNFTLADGSETDTNVNCELSDYDVEGSLPAPNLPKALCPKDPVMVKQYFMDHDHDYVPSAAANATYFPLSIKDEMNPLGEQGQNLNAAVSNTGYIISGLNFPSDSFPYQAGDIRISRYNIENSLDNSLSNHIYDPSTVKILTRNHTTKAEDQYDLIANPGDSTEFGEIFGTRFPKKSPAALGFSKYTHTKEIMDNLLSSESQAYGLHFMKSKIGKDNTLLVPKVQMRGLSASGDSSYTNFELPQDCIDFTLQEKGFINFMAGSYYRDNTSFFSLHHVIRDKDASGNLTTAQASLPVYDRFAHQVVENIPKDFDWSTDPPTEDTPWKENYYETAAKKTQTITYHPIKEIKEIGKIYKHKTDPKQPYLYEYTDQTKSRAAELNDYELIFDTAWLTSPQVMVSNALYYFEIPVNAGEYALGSVADKDGAYLLYLDISASASQLTRTEVTETVRTTVDSFQYPNGVSLAGGENDQIRPAFAALPEDAAYTGSALSANRNGYLGSVSKDGSTLFSGMDIILQKQDGSWAVPPVSKKIITQKIITWYDFDHSEQKKTKKVTTLTDTVTDGGPPVRTVLYQEFAQNGSVASSSDQAPKGIDPNSAIEVGTPLTVHHYGHGNNLTIVTQRSLNEIDLSEMPPLGQEPLDISDQLKTYVLTVSGTAAGQETPDFTLYLDSKKDSAISVTINDDKNAQVPFVAGNFYRISSAAAP